MLRALEINLAKLDVSAALRELLSATIGKRGRKKNRSMFHPTTYCLVHMIFMTTNKSSLSLVENNCVDIVASVYTRFSID